MPNLQYEYTEHYSQMDPVATADSCQRCFEMDEDVLHTCGEPEIVMCMTEDHDGFHNRTTACSHWMDMDAVYDVQFAAAQDAIIEGNKA